MRKQLGQLRPSDTSAASILNNALPWEVDLIVITNVGADAAGASIYHDADGSTYDEGTTIFFSSSIDPNTTVHYEPHHPIANVDGNGNLGVKSGVASGLTFTVYGTLLGERV